ncbi:ABC transporter permease [Planotetraspora kaengkrachanensis]|uniref:Transport permease protein n=1 Tax=Planotetraspora kaengkrachanensis TaxID=575193 RepID=A0A8J3PSJ5_9ACTN|nr:ABC transporter permease [Planotetraspora kaengkrachanensis]GIG79519.1 transport permease protein [Planotetraspora kaengkrachanensis]
MHTLARAFSAPAFRELGYWLFRYRRTWRGSIVISIGNPLLFLTALGLGLGTLVDREDSAYLHGHSYLTFILPGILIAGVMQTAFLEASGPVMQSAMSRGSYRAAASTPLEPAGILYGHLMYWILRATQNAVLFTCVSMFFGTVDPARAPLLVLVAVLVAVAFAAPAAAWAVTVTRPSQINVMFRFVVLPLYMFSGTFFPIEQLPVSLQWVAWATPLWHGVDLGRTVALGTATPYGVLIHIGYLSVMVVIGLYVARRTYRRKLYV